MILISKRKNTRCSILSNLSLYVFIELKFVSFSRCLASVFIRRKFMQFPFCLYESFFWVIKDVCNDHLVGYHKVVLSHEHVQYMFELTMKEELNLWRMAKWHGNFYHPKFYSQYLRSLVCQFERETIEWAHYVNYH